MARMSAGERRELLVQAAIRVMTRDGVANTTTRSIVAEADMPLGVFHYCFRSKEELFEQVMATINETSFDAVVPVLNGDETFEQILIDGLQAYWAHVVKDRGPHQLTYELTQHALRTTPSAAQRQYDHYYELNKRFLAGVTELTRHEWLIPLDTVSRYLLAVIEGVTFQWLVDGDAEAASSVLETCGQHLASLARPVG